jgi:hypothetical protein
VVFVGRLSVVHVIVGGMATKTTWDVCSVCGKAVRRFPTSAALIRCADCRKEFPGPTSVARAESAKPKSYECAECGVVFTRPPTRGQVPRYCGRSCSMAAAYRRKVERYGEFAVSRARRRRLYERDGWVCQICGVGCSRVFSLDDPWSPSLDHVVPRSEGGSDDDDNLRLAHWFCNGLRGAGRATDAEVRVAALVKREGRDR